MTSVGSNMSHVWTVVSIAIGASSRNRVKNVQGGCPGVCSSVFLVHLNGQCDIIA